ncbi:TetR/AcrR family transcriptional regulator [Pendulispora rubella]|uniref:TetR/AcrR family transcriptional regulator n=1 Tax=Pendulispora rubella TaxID=2741070 RepID=A0ABZ2KV83_9BACT
MDRREREKERLRQQILTAARDLLIENGPENVSMRKIAEKIEYSPTTIYLYFKDKTELLFALTEETFAKLLSQLERISERERDPMIAVREMCVAYIRFGLAHPNDYLVAFMVPQAGPAWGEYRYEGTKAQAAFDLLRGAVGECMAKKKFRRRDIDVVSQNVWASIHGLTSLFIAHAGFPWRKKEELIEHLLETLMTGLKSRKDGK